MTKKPSRLMSPPSFWKKNHSCSVKRRNVILYLNHSKSHSRIVKKKDQLFLEFKNNNKQVIKPTYAKEGSWLLHIGISNSVCARFTYMMLRYIPIEEYQQRFFSNMAIHCPCSKVNIETREYIFMQCKRYEATLCPRDICISSFVEFITSNPTSFCFDNG